MQSELATDTQLEEEHQASIPGELGVWVFIIGDMLMFALLFGVYLYYRAADPALFSDAQTGLRQDLALANTLLLLTSSWFVVLGLSAFRSGNRQMCSRLYGLAMACGLGFVILKYVEYGEKFAAGVTINTNEFYTYYFVLTGIHLLHVVVGLGALLFLIKVSSKPAVTTADHTNIESGCLYWHMVDLLWIVILAIIYLI